MSVTAGARETSFSDRGIHGEMADVPESLAGPLVATAREAFAHGLGVAAATAAVIAVAASVLTATRLRHLPSSARADAEQSVVAEQTPQAVDKS
ncbi:hypothetical protein [Streptomyces sp. NPDC017988]|uniref:hypothetical protein n=1 Tax=Streptomyces sp. NPDC017988 TaxID=3365025 RepID=UPI00378EDB32